jgi:hypothetical protein
MSTNSKENLEILKRSTRRVSVSIPDRLFHLLQKRSDVDGRSLSNLCAYLLETSADQMRISE